MKSLTVASLFVLATTMPLIRPPVAAYQVSVKIEPQGMGGSAYELLQTPRHIVKTHYCSVDVTDLSSNTTLRGPRIAINPGDHASKTQSIGGYNLDFSASLSSDGRHASWDVVVRRNGEIVTRQQSDTRLAPTVVER
jgi:hypothetical protein